MSGEQNLDALIRSMTPELQDGVFVFCTLPRGEKVPSHLNPVMSFREKEGQTLILLREDAASAGIDGVFPCRMITLSIHSALEAVGFTAEITKVLAAAGMGVNPVAAFYHDHLFVPQAKAELAMQLLHELSAEGLPK